LAKLTIAQSTALGSNTQALVGGSVTTAAPTYTTGNINPLSLTTAGALRVDGSATTQPVSGTVTANAGTGNFTVVQATASNLRAQTASESATGSATPATAGLAGGAVTTAAPTYTTGNLGALSLTTSGLLRVDGSGVTQPVSGTVTANAGTGNFSVIGTGTDNTTNSTAKLPVIVAKANTSAPTWTDGNMAPLSVDTSGALRVTGTISASNASIGTNNAAIPSSSTQVGGSDGTNLQVLRVFDADTGAGTQYVLGVGLRKFASGGSVELGTSSDPIRIDPTGTTTQPVSGTVTANAGTGNFTVVQATASNLRAQTASESATGSAVPATANLAGGSVTTAAPTYTNGNLGALSLTTSGLLRVDGSGVTQPVSGTVTANIGTSGSLALDATVSTLSGKFASSAALADGASNPTTTTVGAAELLFNGTTFDRARSAQVGVLSSVVGFQNMLPVGRYNATRLTLSDTNYANLQMDGQGNTWTRDGYQPVAEDNINGVIANQTLPLVSTTYAYTTAQGVGALPGNIKGAAGNVFSLYVYNGNASNRFIQLFNSTSAPSGTPLMSILVPGGGSITMGTDFFGPGGFNFSTGITLGFSTAQTTYTAGSAGDCNYVIGYK
jgi:hypothetical protein